MANLFIGFPVPRAKIADMIAGSAPPSLHKTQHQNGGSDEIDCTGLVGAGGGGLSFDGLFLSLLFESLDGYKQTKTGSGTIVLNERGIILGTGSTINSLARLSKLNNYLSPRWNWSKNSEFKTYVEIQSETSAVCNALIQVGNFGNNKHYGFKVTGGKLYGTTGSGAAESTVELETLGAGAYDIYRSLKAVLTAGSKVEFYVDDVKRGEISTNLPTEIDGVPYIIHLEITNPDVTQDKWLWVSHFVYSQEA